MRLPQVMLRALWLRVQQLLTLLAQWLLVQWTQAQRLLLVLQSQTLPLLVLLAHRWLVPWLLALLMLVLPLLLEQLLVILLLLVLQVVS
jgi:hypothetical protein